MKTILLGFLFFLVMGCSVTSLQCGVDGDSSFVNLQSNDEVIADNSRNMAELCSFAYDKIQE